MTDEKAQEESTGIFGKMKNKVSKKISNAPIV
jgi:hypothetical protein